MEKNTKKYLSLLMFILLLVVLACSIYVLRTLKMKNDAYVAGLSNNGSSSAETISSIPQRQEIEITKLDLDFRNLTASTIVDKKVLGWNLGNSFTYYETENKAIEGDLNTYYETAMGNPEVTKELINYVSSCGFSSIRIPVSFRDHCSIDANGNFTLSEAWLNRIQEVIDYCISYDLLVILVPYNDYELIYTDHSNADFTKTKITSGPLENYNNAAILQNANSYWLQIANHFSSYDKHLVFENFSSAYLNTHYDKDHAKIHNQLNQVFVNTIHQANGYNKDRLLVLSTYLNELSDNALENLSIPTDVANDALLIDVYCSEQAFDQSVESTFTILESYYNRFHVPFIIGEFSATRNYTPEGFRDEYASNFVKRANAHGIICYWWDDGSMSGTGLVNRTDFSSSYKEELSALYNSYAINTTYLKDITYRSANDFSFQTVDPNTGRLVDSTCGSLTLTCNQDGYSVEPEHMYMASLVLSESGFGMQMNQIAFYDENMELIEYQAFDPTTTYCFTAPGNASCMRIVCLDPNNPRSWLQYEAMFNNECFMMNIKEYKF